MNNAPETLVDEFSRKRHLYQEFAAKLQTLLSELLQQEGIQIHSISHRAKSIDSFKRKLSRKTANYGSLADVTDLTGVRVITYFEQDVDRVATVIAREFQVDVANTTDKRKALDPDRFGYLSIHHIVSLGRGRQELTEYRRFPALKAEIQTRSILQHAWAEIEHDLGYKTSIEVPKHIRRRFSRVAGLLELADQEFEAIRGELIKYESYVQGAVKSDAGSVAIDKLSLKAFIGADPAVRRLDLQIAALIGTSTLTPPVGLEAVVCHLTLAGMDTVEDVRQKLAQYEEIMVPFAREWIALPDSPGESPPEEFAEGISLFYLSYLVILEGRDRERIRHFLDDAPISDASVREQIADDLLTVHAHLVDDCGV
jgi:ppGpp synthetase/RelA/SpoT-type nucleotidyltranferase